MLTGENSLESTRGFNSLPSHHPLQSPKFEGADLAGVLPSDAAQPGRSIQENSCQVRAIARWHVS
jgi:hypothetical protein